MSKLRHIISVDQFSPADIFSIFEEADILRTAKPRLLAGKVLTNLFYEPSSRTSSSFYSAMVSLGGSVIPINDVNYSSVTKGEDLEDTIMTFSSYSDAIVLRSKEEGSAEIAANISPVPIINAGDGSGEHPTQALLDLYTIWREHSTIDGLEITMMGDLKYGRTVHSLTKLLRLFEVKINFVSPWKLAMPVKYLQHEDTSYRRLNDHILSKTDVLYVTRTQKERMQEGETIEEYSVDITDVEKMKETAIVMHPLPRNGEINKSVDKSPKAAYFRQMKNGLYIRRALLASVLT